MQRQSGNFLVQALLALTLIFAFAPFLVRRLAAREENAQMYSATQQVDTAQEVARIFVRENANILPYGITTFAGKDFTETLEPYGLPLGFVPHTVLGQDISLIVNKNAKEVSAYLKLSGGNLSDLQTAELIRRIGFYATKSEKDIIVGLALADVYSDIVRRNETNFDNSAFLTNLDMGNFVFDNARNIVAQRGEFESGEFNTLSITGIESLGKAKNEIGNMSATKAVFQSKTGESALSLLRGTLTVGSVDSRTVSSFGNAGNFTSNSASVYDFSMSTGRIDFTGPAKWNIEGNVVTDKISLATKRLEVSSFIDASRGQKVYVNPDSLEYGGYSGIETNSIIASNITLRDQTSSSLLRGGTGEVLIDIRPAGTSVLPDVLLDDINNSALYIIARPSFDDGDTISCSAIISDLGERFNQRSLSQYIICQYLFWKRLEERVNIKQCLMEGKNDCT